MNTSTVEIYRPPRAFIAPLASPSAYQRWDMMIRDHRSKLKRAIDWLANTYSYSILTRVFPRTDPFRAGVILIFRAETHEETVMKMLMVQEREAVFMAAGKMKRLPSRLGFPKGQRIAEDKTAFDTARRELREETGIDLFDSRLKAKVCVPTLILPRTLHPFNEVIIYFIVIVETQPDVRICEVELDGYKWVNMIGDLRGVKPTTTTTDSILQQIRNIDFLGPVNCIPI
jgi:8-oxo-dGTP pyrophosphatase MutT (NUDIX family)